MSSKTIIIGGILIAILGVVLYTNFQKPTVKETKNTTTVINNEQPQNQETTFVVKELGIQFTTTEDIQDLVYTTKNNSGRVVAYFTTQSIFQADKKAGGKYCTESPLGAISVSTPDPVGDAVREQVKQFGSKYLYYTSPQDMCSDNSEVQALIINQQKSFRQALKSAVLYNQDAPIDETANWKTYNNNVFSIKYPSAWIVKTDSGSVEISDPSSKVASGTNGGGTIQVPTEYIGIMVDPLPTTAQQYIDNMTIKNPAYGETQADIKNITISGVNGKIYPESGEGSRGYDAVVSKGSHFFVINIPVVDPSSDLMIDQILSTFKFTN